jgi:hypothetical protein
MTADELAAFIAEVRSQVEEALAQLDTVDRDALPPKLRNEYDAARARWEALGAHVTNEDALAMHIEAVERAGRELTADESLALLGLTPPV